MAADRHANAIWHKGVILLSFAQADPSWSGMGPQQGPLGYKGNRRGNDSQPGGKQYAGQADAALAVLQEQFPLYNQDSLTDVLKVCLRPYSHYVGLEAVMRCHTATLKALLSCISVMALTCVLLDSLSRQDF